MFDIILVSHGTLSRALLETAELIAGERKEGIKTFGLQLGDSVDLFGEAVTAAIAEGLTHGDVLVLSDMRSGSPFNVTVGAMTQYKFRHITGLNLPMVIEAVSAQSYATLEEAFPDILDAGTTAVADINAYLDDLDDSGNQKRGDASA